MKEFVFLQKLLIFYFIFAQNANAYNKQDSLQMETFIERGKDLFLNHPDTRRENYDSIIFYFEQAEKIAQADHYPERQAFTYLARFTASNYIGDYQTATIFAQKAYSFSKSNLPAEHSYQASAVNNLSIIYSNVGNYRKASELIKEAVSFLQKHPDIPLAYSKIIQYYSNQGNFLAHAGDYTKAIETYQKGLKMGLDSLETGSKELELEPLIATLYYNLGLKSVFLGDYDQAIQYLKQNLAFLKKYFPKSLSDEIDTRNSLANAYYESGLIDQAYQQIQKAEALQRISKRKNGEGWYEDITYTIKARILGELGNFEEAYKQMDTSFIVVGQLSYNSELLANGYLDYGTLYAKHKQFRRALSKYQSALIEFAGDFDDTNIYYSPSLDQFGIVKDFHAEIISLRMKAFLSLFQYDQNKKYLEGAFDNAVLFDQIVETLRKNIETEGTQLYLSKKAKIGFESAIHSAILMYEQTGNDLYKEYALSFVEKVKNIILYSSLHNESAKYVAKVPKDILDKTYNVKTELAFLRSTLFEEKFRSSEPDITKINELEDKIFIETQTLDSLNDRLERDYPTYYQLKYSQEEFDIKEVQENLNNSTLLLEYFVGDSALYIFALNKKGIEYKVIENSSTLHAQVDQFVKSLHEVNSEDYKIETFRSEAFELYLQIFDPKWGDHRNLIIIPDGILGLLPFEILLKHEEGSHFGELPYLLKDHNIQYAYSAQLLFNDPLKEQVKAAQKNWAGFAPQFEGLRSLPLSVEEVEQIAQLMQGETYTHQRADKATFLAEAKDYRILHLATHGYPNVEDPQFARLEFTTKDGSNDGVLYAHELMNERLAAELAVLSACETGYGSIAKGEGIMSLARSFRYAGVPSIVMSLWKAESGVSKKIMASFYTYLQDGKGKDEALRLAKLDYLKAPLPGRSHPRAWSHFVLIGDASPITKHSGWVWLISLLIPVLILLFIGLRGKNRQNSIG